MSQQYSLAGKDAKHILACIRKTSRSRDVMFALPSALVILHPEYCVQFGASQYKRDLANLEQVQQAEGQQLRGWSICPVRRGWASWACSAWQRDSQEISLLPTTT